MTIIIKRQSLEDVSVLIDGDKPPVFVKYHEHLYWNLYAKSIFQIPIDKAAKDIFELVPREFMLHIKESPTIDMRIKSISVDTKP